ncbi:hypothetical protein [Streptococcus sp. 21WXBC0057M1]|jgi:hypothetical protein|uniref:Uncharacterized protein n=1 Tax=Streptococcus wuxiensis TaxID=3095078 RepID=A0ABU5FQK1_9STRE|nr:hypothetical protein [Streptococcus sp. 21WXBC0057M1]MDY4337197.1 hypothetical protein [Streptococcus sp. 21WXBC0057M1]
MVLETGLKVVIRVYYSKAHKEFLQTGYCVKVNQEEFKDLAGISCKDESVAKFDTLKIAASVIQRSFKNTPDIRYVPMYEYDAIWLDEKEKKFNK